MSDNYAKVYEFKLNNCSNLTIDELLKKIRIKHIRKKSIETENGTFYIKDFKDSPNSIILLFGKDNEDASNYKREKSTNNIEKIEINEDTEILTDFVHIAVSKVKKLGSYTLLLERSSLITHHNLSSFIKEFFITAMSFSLSRRVTSNFYDEVVNSNRIISVTQVSKRPKAPFLSANNNLLNDIEVKENIEIKAKRAKTIPVPYFDKLFTKINNDPESKLVVEIMNTNGNKMLLDFDVLESPYSIATNIEENNKTDLIQRNIAYSLDTYIKRNNDETT